MEESNHKEKKTSQQRSPIGIADLLTVIHTLPWQNEEQIRLMAESLGFRLPDAAFKPDDTEEKTAFEAETGQTIVRPHQARKPIVKAPPSPSIPVELSKSAVPQSVELSASEEESGEAAPNWLQNADSATFPSLFDDEPAETGISSNESKQEHRHNLIPDLASRGILSAALATYRVGTSLDIRKIITNMVSGHGMTVLPYKKAITLDQGCQLLLDYNELMTPCWPDLNALTKQLDDVMGSERVTVFEFDNNPLDAKRWLNHKNSKQWQVDAGRPVLVASNLDVTPSGIGTSLQNNSDQTRQWLEFITLCREQSAPLVILFPWGKKYLPKHLGSYPILIHWHPSTTISQIRQWIGKAHEVHP